MNRIKERQKEIRIEKWGVPVPPLLLQLLLRLLQMLTDLGIVFVAVIVLTVALLVKAGRNRIAAHGALVLIGRWLTGHPWHGKPVTDAGWFRPASGRPAFTPTGHAPRFHYRPRWQRMASRSGRALFAILLLLVWVNYPRTAPLITILLAATFLIYACFALWWHWQGRKHRRTWVEPLHLVAAPLVGLPTAKPASSWLAIEPDRSKVVAELPPGYNPDAKDKERLVDTFATKLGLDAPDVKWALAGPEPRLELCASQPPPARVALADVREALDRIRPDDMLWGIGRRSAEVTTSLSGDSPHIGLSMGSGAGKSATARALLAQMLYRGAIGLILDYKMISHQWAAGLPNVVIARRPSEIHAALVWLGGDSERGITGEVNRRNEVALAGADIEGNVNAAVGPRIIVVCEELNATVARLKAYWRQERTRDEPVRSPALEALDAVSFMGRQVLTNVIYIGQRLSVRASGGDGDARENIGVIGFGRYSASNWKMLAPDFPMPPKSLAPGRMQVVSDRVRETQGVYMTAKESRALATAGTVSLLPAGMPGAARVLGAGATQIPGSDQGFVTDTPPSPVTSGPSLVTLSEAVKEGVVSCSLGALRIARHRGNGFPEPEGQRGLAQEFDPLKLAEWDAARH